MAVQQETLDGSLVREVEDAFEVPDVPGVAERLLDVSVRGQPAEFVHEEESRDQEELADEGRPDRDVRLRVHGPAAGVYHPMPLR